MEYLSKREYLRRYVSRVDQLRIGVLGLLVLFGGAIGIALGLRGQNHGLALWGLLIAVMGLGVLQFQSLACSVGTMVCGLAGVTGLIDGMNPICGGLLILAAIGAIRLTYLLNRDYCSYRDSSAPAPENRQALSKGDGPAAAAVFIPLLGMMCSMGLIAFSLSPFFLEQLVGHARTPEELLQGYSQWYNRGDQRSGVSDPDRGCGSDPLLEVGHRCGKGHPSDASHHGLPAAAGRVHAAQ